MDDERRGILEARDELCNAVATSIFVPYLREPPADAWARQIYNIDISRCRAGSPWSTQTVALNARSRVVKWAEPITTMAPGIIRQPLAGKEFFNQLDGARGRAWFFRRDELASDRAHHDQAEQPA